MLGGTRFRSVDVMTNNTFIPETTVPDATIAPSTAGTATGAGTGTGMGTADPTAETTAYPAGATYPTPPAYSAPAYPAAAAAAQPQPQAPYYPAQPKTNVLGIVTLVLGILGFGLIPVITGHIALGQIRRTNEDGRGITLAGLILGYITLAGWLLVAFFWVAVAGVAVFGSALGTN